MSWDRGCAAALSSFLLWLRLRRWPLLPLLLRFECFLLAFCCSRRGVSIYLEALSTAFLLLVVLWPCSNRRIRCGLPEWFFLVPAPPWSIPMGCSGTVVGGFGGLLSILANRSPIMWVGRYEKDRGRTFPVFHEEDDRGPRSICKCTSHPLINAPRTLTFSHQSTKSL